MTAYKAMNEILNINETIEDLKERNMGDTPDLVLCATVELLENYRDLLGDALTKTKLKNI